MTAQTATAVAMQYWLAALDQPIGLGLKVSDPAAAKRQLYAARASSNIEALSAFTIRTSPRDPAGELFLLRTPEAVAPQAA